jgi:hypothetical protein
MTPTKGASAEGLHPCAAPSPRERGIDGRIRLFSATPPIRFAAEQQKRPDKARADSRVTTLKTTSLGHPIRTAALTSTRGRRGAVPAAWRCGADGPQSFVAGDQRVIPSVLINYRTGQSLENCR